MNSEIVPVSLILSASDIGREDWRMVTLARALSTPDNAIKWLVCRRLLHNTYTCTFCQSPMQFGKCQGVNDGRRWNCRPCGKKKSIRYVLLHMQGYFFHYDGLMVLHQKFLRAFIHVNSFTYLICSSISLLLSKGKSKGGGEGLQHHLFIPKCN